MTRLFEGQTFFLARTLHTEESKKAKHLIQTNGGKVTTDMQTKNVTTVVGKRALTSKSNPGSWVPVELIFDSIAMGELQPLKKYHQPTTPAQQGKAIRRRVKYTVEDDVRMLDFLETLNNGRLPAVNEYVPIQVWETAANQKVTNHSAASMNEHYRKILNKWTPKERRNAIENAKKLKSSSIQEAAVPVDVPVSTSSPSPKPPSQAIHLESRRDEDSQAATEVVNAEEASDHAREQLGEPTPKEMGIAIRGKVKFTDEDDVRMLDFVKRRKGGQLPKSISMKLWKIAESMKVTEHSAESMRQHYQVILNKWTPMELRNIIEKAKLQKEREGINSRHDEALPVSTAKVPEPVAILSPKRKTLSRSEDSEASVDTDDMNEPVRKGKKKIRAISSASEQSATQESEHFSSDAYNAGVKVPKPTDSNDTVSRDEARIDEEASDLEESENRCEESPGGMFIHSYWEKRLAEATREELSPYLQPRKPTSSSVANEQSPNDSHQAPQEHANSTLTKRRQRSNPFPRGAASVARSDPTNASVVTTNAEEEKLISLIQFETGQDIDAVAHALYFTSGNVDAAISFLRGRPSPTFWNTEDDKVLQSWAREHDTPPSAPIISAAKKKGEFASLSRPRSGDAILARLRFLS